MKIIELRILPPIAIARLGSSNIPLEAYDLDIPKESPLDYRQIIPKESLVVDIKTGELKSHLPTKIRFKDAEAIASKDGKIRPVAPFLEVFARTSKDPSVLLPLTMDLLKETGYNLGNLEWEVDVANFKLFRRTEKESDKIQARVSGIKDHLTYELKGKCKNFLKGKFLPLGTVQFIKPSAKHPEIRLRFTPAEGKVYGSSKTRKENSTSKPVNDNVLKEETQIIYNKAKDWAKYSEPDINPKYTAPGSIYAGYDGSDGWTSWGYLDDACDGVIKIKLQKKGTKELCAIAHITSGPPAFAPDILPIRVVTDELEQILLGTDVDKEISIEEAEELIRRAFESIRLMNTAIMNGNDVNGKQNIASTMVRQDTNDFGRLFEPIMATSIVDNLALQLLHERVFNGLSTGTAPWFADALRKPEEVGDLSNKARRKMPALMRGADGRMLTLTRRQINKIIKAAATSLFQEGKKTKKSTSPISLEKINAKDLMTQLHYRGKGNPVSVLPRTAISNCFPGLEFDFRNLWRKAFNGITLSENNNFVMFAEKKYKELIGCRLVGIDFMPTMVLTTGPTFPDADSGTLATAVNPNAVTFMEWSNSMARIMKKQGKDIVCHFTKEESPIEVIATEEELKSSRKFKKIKLRLNYFFNENTATFSEDVIKPGELTQGLCAPWQNDYRECACYYWAASRPDYVNVVPDSKGLSKGDNWMSKKRNGEYLPDDRSDSRLLSYDDLFKNWEGELNFIIKGKDALETDN